VRQAAAFLVAHLLDPRFWTEDNGRCRPDQAFLRAGGDAINAARDLVRRMSDDGAAADLQFLGLISRGSTDKALPAMQRVEQVDGWRLPESMDTVRMMWETVLMVEFPLLADIAIRLFHMHATSCSVERLWSVLRNVARDNRPRLGIEKTEKLLFIMAEERMASKEEEDVPQEYLVESVLGF
jgi:hypothetical protein